MKTCGKRAARKGFSLVESAFAIVLVGLGVTALMTACASSTQASGAGHELSQAISLATEIREWSVLLPFSETDPGEIGNAVGPDFYDPAGGADDLDDLMNASFSPARNGSGVAIADMPGWTQNVKLTWLNPTSLTEVTAGSSDVVEVEVDILLSGTSVFTASWIVVGR